MTRRPKPVVHRRDHEHGGADPVRIHFEDVGDSGGGGGGGALPTIKAYASSVSVSPHFVIGSISYPWEYRYLVEDSTYLFIDSDTNLMARASWDSVADQGALYLVTAFVWLEGTSGTDPRAAMWVKYVDSDIDFWDRQRQVSRIAAEPDATVNVIRLQTSFVMAGGPPSVIEVWVDAGSPSLQANLTAVLINPGPVPN